MSSAYYYFAASLPELNLDQKPVLSFADFLIDAQRLLSKRDFQELTSIISDDLHSLNNTTAQKWMVFNHHLKNELAAFRASKAKKDLSNYIRGQKETNPYLHEAVLNASKMSNLLEAEKSLDRVKWLYLEELSVGHYYDFDSIVIYALKLKICERYENIKSPAGKEKLEQFQSIQIPQ